MNLPHTRTARLLTSIVRSDATSIEAVGRIPGAHPLVQNGRLPSLIGIEVGAQAAAALQADGPAATQIRSGRLVRVRDADFIETQLPAETDLIVIAELESAALPLATYRIRVLIGDRVAVHATISTYQV